MFKKGKKKETTKFDQDLYGQDEGGKAEIAEENISNNLAEKIEKIKSKEKPKPKTISFAEEAFEDNFAMKKKPLYNSQVNIQEEERKETLQQRIEDKKYNVSYLEELRRANEKQNESAREIMQSVRTLQDLGHDEEDILRPQDNDFMQIEEDEEMDEEQKKAIEKAKDIREKKRKLNTGDYISLTERNDDVGDLNKKQVLMDIFKESKEKKDNKETSQEIEEESDEEFNELENRILKQNVNIKTMKNINSFLKKTYNQEREIELKKQDETKMILHEVDLEYVIKTVDESLKTDEARYQDNIERIQKIFSQITVSEDTIDNLQKEYDRNAASLENYQDIMDYMNDISDCLGEKKNEVTEADNTLKQLEDNYSNIRYTRLKMDISDQLEEEGAPPLEFNDENLNHKRKTEKSFRKNKRNENIKAFIPEAKIAYLLEGLKEDQERPVIDEDLNNLKYDKVALYLAAKDIFKEVVEEYTNKSIIFTRFYELVDRYVAEEGKVLEWIFEALSPFASIDMVGYDPLGYTDAEHEFHNKVEFTGLPFFKEMILLQESYQNADQKDMEARYIFIKKLINNIYGEIVKNRLKDIIEKLWNPFSESETNRLTSALKLFIEVYYKQTQNKLQKHLENIKDILVSVTNKLRNFIDILVFPQNSAHQFGCDMLIQSAKLMKSVLLFRDILPLSNIIQISISNLLCSKISKALSPFSAPEQVIFLSEILRNVSSDILNHEHARVDIETFKSNVANLIAQNTIIISSQGSGIHDNERITSAINKLKEILKLNV